MRSNGSPSAFTLAEASSRSSTSSGARAISQRRFCSRSAGIQAAGSVMGWSKIAVMAAFPALAFVTGYRGRLP
jgi:hypothetical protein